MSNESCPPIRNEGDVLKVLVAKLDADVEITTGLPEGTEVDLTAAQNPQFWLDLMNSNDAAKRKVPMDIMKAMKYEPTKFVHWGKPDRASILAAHATLSAGAGETKTSTKEKKTTKTSNKEKAAAAAAPAATSAGSDNSEVLARLDALEEELGSMKELLTDAHFLIRAMVSMNTDLVDILPELVGDLHGTVSLEVEEGND